MELKRHYHRMLDEQGAVQLDEFGRVQVQRDKDGAPVLKHIEVRHTGSSRAQHFSTGLVAAGLAEGWMTISKGQLILHGQPEDLVYTITRVPGEYRTEDGGREVIHYYDCVLDEAQHQRFCAQAKGGARG